ncbi:cellulase family glycosylhydrolase [Clostridium cellulovorans]|uniref:LPXTG-motif cell wall anchor domain protein n=2 Tax=Clostridium cellulovorans TaxID=1493 RepID=D9SQV7_CLOC7|nr:cellulase family glycosylhydrolase [Clostridium cellulovorans]ADL52313.1 LPXTG-motif cell wall anchor domain protein [Clostridium cellulovorans 743B]BAV13065.1 endoglucanase [Clostridium cellulovorans]
MKKAKKLFMSFMALVLTISTFLIGAPTLKAEALPNEAVKSASQTYVDAMQPGWNLGNSFDSFDTGGDKGEQSWGNPVVTKELIHTIKAQGFKSIRIPFTSVMRTGAAPDYKIDPTFLARYAEVVQWALDEGFYVMVNIHHDSWNWAARINTEPGNEYMAQYKALWVQLADYFKDYPDQVCFESLNEPQFWVDGAPNQIKILEAVNNEFYNVVRNSGGNNAKRMLVLPTLNTNDSDDKCESLYNTITAFNDPNIIATFHYYGFWPFSTNIAGTTTMNDTVVTELNNAFDRMYNHFTANGIGVVCGEYGLLGFDKTADTIEPGELLKYMEYINYYAKAKGITLMLWDNGNVIDRYKYEWHNKALGNMIKTSWNTRSSYTDSDRIFVKAQDKDNDVLMKLTLNGNTLKSIYNGNTELTLNKDYTLVDNTVTLKGDYIKNLITESLGINATLTFKFSSGEEWNVYLTHYATPLLSAGQGTAAGFDIPVQFNGSKLSTLEALNADGSGAGPQNWTTYKEYNYAFKVDYDNNKVTITDKFFKEAKDGEITLKYHFQSGEVMIGKFLKAGDVVTHVNCLSYIENISTSVIEGQTYTLPSTVSASYSDGSKKDLAVSWTSSSVDTSKVGIYAFEGNVEGFDRSVLLTLTVKPSITSIEDITSSVPVGYAYTLPTTVSAVYSDGSKKEVSVAWTPSTVDTSKVGTYTFKGSVLGFSKQVSLTLTVYENPAADPIKDIINKINDETVTTVTMDANANPLIVNDIFKALKGKDKTLTIVTNGATWVFNGKDITNVPSGAIDLSLKSVSDQLHSKEKAKAKAIVGKDVEISSFSFNHDGYLPGPTKITLSLGSSFANKTVTIYRYFADTDSTEVITDAIADANGNVTITLDHCSDYFAVEKASTEKTIEVTLPQTGSVINGTVLASVGAILVVVGIVLVGFRRRKHTI